MQKTTLTRRRALSLLPSIILFCTMNSSGATEAEVKARTQPGSDPRLEMVTALKAIGPHPSVRDQANVFDRLIGTWDVEYTDFSKDGKQTHRTGQFIVGWVMDGRVIQDFWIVDPSGVRKDREVYTDLRYYDPKSRTWPSTFIDPKHASVARFTGGAVVDDRIAFETPDFASGDTRWSINDLRSDSFVWREEETHYGGKTWRLLAEHHIKRRTGAPRGRIFKMPPVVNLDSQLQAWGVPKTSSTRERHWTGHQF